MIPELSSLLRDSVLNTLEDRVAVSFSGGLDSTLLAKIANEKAEIELFTAGIEGAPDIAYAEKIAGELGLPIVKCIMEKEEIIETYHKCYKISPEDFLKVELLVPIYRIADEAKKRGHKTLLIGAGAEELFVGYERYYTYMKEGRDLDSILKDEFRTLNQREINWISKICRNFDIEARYPFHNKKLADFVFEVPLEIRVEEYELKKGVLREAASFLGVPETAVKRKKKALQYGSGIHNILLKERNLPGMSF